MYIYIYSIQGDTRRYEAIKSDIRRYKAIQGDTRRYTAIQGDIRRLKAIPGDTRRYKAIHSDTRRFHHSSSNTWPEPELATVARMRMLAIVCMHFHQMASTFGFSGPAGGLGRPGWPAKLAELEQMKNCQSTHASNICGTRFKQMASGFEFPGLVALVGRAGRLSLQSRSRPKVARTRVLANFNCFSGPAASLKQKKKSCRTPCACKFNYRVTTRLLRGQPTDNSNQPISQGRSCRARGLPSNAFI